MELRDALGCWEREEVFWLSCLWSWWWKQVQCHPVGVDAFLAQCGFLTLEMGVKGKWGWQQCLTAPHPLSFCTPSWHKEPSTKDISRVTGLQNTFQKCFLTSLFIPLQG